MKWGTVIMVSLEPVIGSEANKVRPCLIVGNNKAVQAAQFGGVVNVLPITSNVTRVYPFQVLLDARHAAACGLQRPSKIQAEQIRSIDIRRVTAVLQQLPADLIDAVKDALRLQLDL